MSPFADPMSDLLGTAAAFGDPRRAPWCRRILRRHRQLFGESALTWK